MEKCPNMQTGCVFFWVPPAVFPASSLVIYRTTSQIHLRLLLTAARRPWSENSQLLVAHLSLVNEKWQISFFHALDSKETLISLRKKCSIEMNDSLVSNRPNVALMTISWRAKYFFVVWLIVWWRSWNITMHQLKFNRVANWLPTAAFARPSGMKMTKKT